MECAGPLGARGPDLSGGAGIPRRGPDTVLTRVNALPPRPSRPPGKLPPPGDALLVGTTVAGRYHLVRLLGDGGMGSVYKAADTVLRRFVAIKLLHRSTTRKSPASVDRFQREARAAAAIGHPNIIDILDFGTEEGRPYMVMEYLRGHSLSQVLATEGALAVPRAVSIAAHTLAGLAAAHERGILHRDLKPANLMIVARFGDKNFVKVCDFGFAALMGPSSAEDGKTLTPERTLVGTPVYAAPERLRGDERRDPRTDVYSVGVLLFEMIAGRRPFDAPTFRELAEKVWHAAPPPLASSQSSVPSGLDAVIRKALAKSPEHRFGSASELAAALVPFGGRTVSLEDELPSDTFSLEVLQIKARDAKRKGARPSGEVSQAGDRTVPRMPVPIDPAEQDETTWRSKPPRALPVPIAPEAASDDTVATAEVKGRFALSVLRFVARKHHERAVREVLAAMPQSARAPFDLGLLDEAWVEAHAVEKLVEQIDARLGTNDLHTIVECGRAAAEGAFDAMRALKPPSPPPELVFQEMPAILGALLRGIGVEIRQVGRGHGRLEVIERQEPSLVWGVLLLGFVERSLQRFGAEDVEVNLLGGRALGDAETILDASWIG